MANGTLTMKIKPQFKLINEHQLQLQRKAWQSTCERLGRVPGLQSLWRIFRGLSGNGKGNPPLTELFLSADPSVVEDEIITTFFPHASLTPLTPPNRCTVQQPDPDLDRPFSMGEMNTAVLDRRLGTTESHGKNSATSEKKPRTHSWR
ncbi:hypothetical protein HPB52_004983 [Rhipicephalus sanguineus]|uniref:Uncharacterized protein n=1 Tax=Rhipicephalus sanguineus TaxID=34632 RepID=A0A9D4SVV2_RHISA|nr:hypothetical protein HPB52_004983 [Rhipicephalus sanguineus]